MTGAPRHPFLPARRYFELLALPPLRPAAFFWAVVPPCLEELELELELDPDFLPPRLEAPGEFAIRAARSFDMPFFFSPSYCFSFFTLALLLGIAVSSCVRDRTILVLPGEALPNRAQGSRRSSGSTAGPSRTAPSTSKRDPWHGQSQLRSAALKRRRQPRCVHRSETPCSSPASSR